MSRSPLLIALKRLAKKFVYAPKHLFFGVLSFVNTLMKREGCFKCPVCGYYGKFKAVHPETGERKYAACPNCGSLERHRLQTLIFEKMTGGIRTNELSMLHFAPEEFFRSLFKTRFKIYVTADLNAPDVDRKEDLTKLSFPDESFDFIYASHVLEHIKNDAAALSEIRRVLKKGGVAILPVPVIGEKTIEYPEPNPHEHGHVRCPGVDYYDRYKGFFKEVRLYSSRDFDEKFQTYTYENRRTWPATMPLRPSVPGERHTDIVAVCYK